jgi:hypothetical protein
MSPLQHLCQRFFIDARSPCKGRDGSAAGAGNIFPLSAISYLKLGFLRTLPLARVG